RFSQRIKSSFGKMSLAPATGLWLWTWRKVHFTNWQLFGGAVSPTFSTSNIRSAYPQNGKSKTCAKMNPLNNP
ncbi:MAG TPA: hypothetical protein VN516_07020, partial [Candidatus Baltobacteraceae bacterium]|nr:hypothetical protein [Candidatus Baltobacteraceae bacterium]